jgi:hypothetical protein
MVSRRAFNVSKEEEEEVHRTWNKEIQVNWDEKLFYAVHQNSTFSHHHQVTHNYCRLSKTKRFRESTRITNFPSRLAADFACGFESKTFNAPTKPNLAENREQKLKVDS